MLNLDNSELIHAAGSAWNNHKYIKKIGNRYFYTRDEYDAYITSQMKKGKIRSSPVYNDAPYSLVRKSVPITSKKTVGKTITRGTIGSTGVFKKKQSIGEAFTSGIKSAGKKISDATGETERKRAEAMELLSGILAMKSAASKKELDTASQNRKMADLTTRKMREKAQLYEDEAAVSKAASDVKKYDKLAYERDKTASAMEKAGGQYKRYAPSARAISDQYRKMSENAQKEVDKLTSAAEALRFNADVVDNMYTKQYSRDVVSAQKKYEADLKAYEAVLSAAQTYRERYGNTVSGKLEKAANDVQRAYNDVVQSASEAIDAGKQFAKETASKVSTGVSELATKASDTVASGLAWVESVFAPKKKK